MKLERRNLPLLMLEAREALLLFFRPAYVGAGLTEQQWRVIRALHEDGETSIGQLADRCKILAPSLTGVLERMIQGQLIVKRIDDYDTRRFYVSLTRGGLAKFEEVAPLIEEGYRNLESQAGAETVRNFYRQIDDFLQKLTTPGPPQPATEADGDRGASGARPPAKKRQPRGRKQAA